MKHFLLTLFIIVTGYASYAQIGIGTTEPSPSAVLDLNSTTAGFLPPRMTFAQIEDIDSPVEGLIVYCTNCEPKGLYVYDGASFLSGVTGSGPEVASVTPITGKVWMDRNLGASRVATSSTDVDAYGDLYQWGRATEGHEKRTSATTTSLATTAVPGLGNSWDGMFIVGSSSPPFDWLYPQDDNLWEGSGGTNNPCPNGYRLPTIAEWDAERGTWGAAGAFASVLKLTLAGRRSIIGEIENIGTSGGYWSSDIDNGEAAEYLYLWSITSNNLDEASRSYGLSVRCIKD